MDDDKTEGENLDSTETAQSESPVLPKRVGPYRILERLGEGGMGVVYLAGADRAGTAQGRAQDHQARDAPGPTAQ